MAERLRTLPHRREAEAALLGGVLLRGLDALDDALAHVDVDDFYLEQHQAVFRAMVMLAEQRTTIDVVTLSDQLRRCGQLELVGGIEGLARLDRHATAHNITAHAELVAEVARRRRVVIACRVAAGHG